MKKSILLLVVLSILATSTVMAQRGQFRSAQRDAIEKLSAMAGEWEGKGTFSFGDNTVEYEMEEEIETVANGTALLISGYTESPGRDGEVRRRDGLVALITFDPETETYRLYGKDAFGRTVDQEIKVGDNEVTWESEGFRGMAMRENRKIGEDGKLFIATMVKGADDAEFREVRSVSLTKEKEDDDDDDIEEVAEEVGDVVEEAAE